VLLRRQLCSKLSHQSIGPPGVQQQTRRMLLQRSVVGTDGHRTVTLTLPHTMRALSDSAFSDIDIS